MAVSYRRCLWGARLGAVLCLVLTLSACARFVSPERGVQRAGKWLGADAAVVIVVQDADRARERWKETAMGKAWSDVSVEYWRAQQMAPLTERLFERIGAPGASELLDLVSGDAILALEVPSRSDRDAATAAPESPAAYALLDFGENALKARSLVPSGTAVRSEKDARGGTGRAIEAHSAPSGDAPVLFSSWAGKAWIVSSSRKGLEEILERRARKKTLVAPLRTQERWRRVARQVPREADAFAFADLARIYAAASERLESAAQPDRTPSSANAETDRAFSPDMRQQARALLRLLGAESLDLASVWVEMRGQGFYSRAAVETKEGAKGLANPWREGPPLKTPDWMTKNVSGFSAARMAPPSETLALVERFVEAFGPQGGQAIESAKRSFRERTGVDLDAMLGRMGTERATVALDSVGMPGLAVLWESSEPAALAADLVKCFGALGMTSSKRSMAGVEYEAISSPGVPIGLCVAQINGFAMLSSSTEWLREFAQRREAARTNGIKADPRFPAGPDSLLPILEEPFGKMPRGMTAVGRSYSNPGPALAQINAFLPLAIPMLNLQLQRSGAPTIPSWIMPALPPILPFAQNAFPTVSRIEMKDNLTVSEKYSAFDPLVSPLAAAAFAIAGKIYLRSGE